MRVHNLIPSFLFAVAAAQQPELDGNAVVLGVGGTYPRAIMLADGSLLGVYTDTRNGNHTIRIVAPPSSGGDWTSVGVVETGPDATRDIDNPYIHQLPNGHILCAFRNHDRVTRDTYSFYRITVCISEDLGRNWRYLSTPASDPNPTPTDKKGSWEPFFQQALDDSLQLYYSRENNGQDQDSLLRNSTDNGEHWSLSEIISGRTETIRDGMLGVARIAPNSPEKLAIFEAGNLPDTPFSVHTVRSTNDGADWDDSRTTVHAPAGHNAGAPQITRVGTRLVASFGTDEDGGVWPEGAIKVKVSRDQGRSWGDLTTVHGVPAYWAGIVTLDDNTFLALYESGGTSYAQRMVFRGA